MPNPNKFIIKFKNTKSNRDGTITLIPKVSEDKCNFGIMKDFIEIEIYKKILAPFHLFEPDYKLIKKEYYYPQSKRNIIKRRVNEWGKYNEFPYFLEKLFQFAEKEKIKRMRTNYKIDTKILEEVKIQITKRVIFKVSDHNY
ncbi:MAG: hypothetical protein I3274_05600 [Candidatus Moeniiplasma glomeromycotorum]|nr:hypothetical protein [Candidatus Moeniiplasma glomeromycotorum]